MIPPVQTSTTALLPTTRAVAAQRDRHTHAAQQLVSQLFYVPLLAEVRRAGFGGKTGHGGRGEEIFGEQLDLHLADAVARNQRGGLVAQVVRDLNRREGVPTAGSSAVAAGDPRTQNADRARVRAALQMPALSAAPTIGGGFVE